MSLADLPIDRPVATGVVLAGLTVLGAVAITQMPLDFLPAVDRPEVEVHVPYAGGHPLEAVREVAQPLEDEVALVPGVRRLRTTARAGEVTLDVELGWGSGDLARLEVREAVERARPRLPPEVGTIRIEGGRGHGPASGAILQGRISAERDLRAAWDLLDRRIRRPLERVPGVARVDLYGAAPPEVRIDLDFAALRRHGVPAAAVIERLESADRDADAGAVRGALRRSDVRVLGRLPSLEELRRLRVGDGLRLGDVAEVAARQPRLDYGRHLNRRFALGIDVYREPSANTVETVARLKERIALLERDPRLEGVELLVWQDAGAEIVRSLTGLRDAGLFGSVLAVLVLFGFLRSVRGTAVVAAAIPFSLVVACGAMYLLGSQFDVLTLLGLMLGVGMLVDNAVVVIENIHRLQGDGHPAREAARQGVKQVGLAVVASTATSVIVWSWLLVTEPSPLTIYMGGVALTICLAVVCSLLLSVTFIPMATARLAVQGPAAPGFLLARLVPAYRALLAWTLRRRFLTLLALALLAGSAAWPIGRIEKQGEPRMRQRAVAIHYRAHDPATRDVMERYVDEVEAWLAPIAAALGETSIYSYFSDQGRATTQLYLPRDQTGEEAVRTLRRRLEADLPEIAGVDLEVGDRMWGRNPGGPREGRRVVPVALHGDDPEALLALAARVEERLAVAPDVVAVRGPSDGGRREVRIRVDAERARAVGLTPRDVAQAVAFVFRGRRLHRFRRGDEELEMRVGLPEHDSPGLADLAGLSIPTPRGEPAPLAALADIAIDRVPPEIERTDRETTTWVEVQLDEGVVSTTEAGQDRVRAALAGLALPSGYRWDFGTWGEDRDDVLTTMGRGVALSLIVVVLLMAALFESLLQPLAIVVTLPLAFFGAFWALWGGGYALDAVAFIGVIILIGIVVNNGIVMVDHVNALRRRGLPREEALVLGCGHRLRPVLMTAITTVFGLLPLAFTGPTVAGAYIDSLAVAVTGGLATSTLFTLVALPVWYTAVEDLGSLAIRLLPRRVGARWMGPPGGGVLADPRG